MYLLKWRWKIREVCFVPVAKAGPRTYWERLCSEESSIPPNGIDRNSDLYLHSRLYPPHLPLRLPSRYDTHHPLQSQTLSTPRGWLGGNLTDGEIPAKWERKRLLVGCAGQGKKGKITTNTYGSCERCGCYNFISRPHALPPPATVGLCYLGRAD